MHLILASSLVPCGSPASGFEIANAAIADGLRRAGARVTHLGFQWPQSTLSEPDDTLSLGAVDLGTDRASTRRKLGWLAAAMRAGIPFASAKLRTASPERVRAALGRLAPFDALVVNATALAGAFEEALTAGPYMFVAHNVEHETARQSARHAGSVVERLAYRREARLLEALETRLIAGARHVLTLSEADRAAFGLAGSCRADVLPLAMPAPDGAAGARVPAFDVGLIGTWTWAANRVGLEWFLQEVMPLMPERASVAVAGALPAGFPRRDARVRFLGRVIDAKRFQRQCRVMALAARAGTGVQLKTIEAFELGLPAVATPSSVRGIARVPANVRVEAEPAGFAVALAEQVAAHGTGAVADLDGTAFRHGQLARMDAVIATALRSVGGAGSP